MSDLPNIVYFGSDAICLPGLDYLKQEAANACNLRAVVSQPDRRKGRGKQLQPNPVATWALANGIELLQPEKPTRELADWLRKQNVSLGLVMAYGHFLSKSLREAPQQGLLNFHGSLLPKYRGASPVETALAMGETETGVALMQVAREMDAGAVADVERVPISEAVTAAELRAQVGEAVVPLLRRNLQSILAGELVFKDQDAKQATFCRKLRKEDGAVDFALSAAEIHNRLRAFTPWPGGYFDHGEKRIKVGHATAEPDATATAHPGMVMSAASSLQVATGKGLICFHELQLPGARMLPVADFLRGYEIVPGEQLIGGIADELVSTAT
jgi:methionyl-tRNA formyltransferase